MVIVSAPPPAIDVPLGTVIQALEVSFDASTTSGFVVVHGEDLRLREPEEPAWPGPPHQLLKRFPDRVVRSDVPHVRHVQFRKRLDCHRHPDVPRVPRVGHGASVGDKEALVFTNLAVELPVLALPPGGFLSVGRGAHPEVAAELPGERRRRGEPALPGNDRDRPGTVHREVARGGGDAHPADERPHRLTDQSAEHAVEVVRGEVGHPGEGAKGQVLVEVLTDERKHAPDPSFVLVPRDLPGIDQAAHWRSVPQPFLRWSMPSRPLLLAAGGGYTACRNPRVCWPSKPPDGSSGAKDPTRRREWGGNGLQRR